MSSRNALLLVVYRSKDTPGRRHIIRWDREKNEAEMLTPSDYKRRREVNVTLTGDELIFTIPSPWDNQIGNPDIEKLYPTKFVGERDRGFDGVMYRGTYTTATGWSGDVEVFLLSNEKDLLAE